MGVGVSKVVVAADVIVETSARIGAGVVEVEIGKVAVGMRRAGMRRVGIRRVCKEEAGGGKPGVVRVEISVFDSGTGSRSQPAKISLAKLR